MGWVNGDHGCRSRGYYLRVIVASSSEDGPESCPGKVPGTTKGTDKFRVGLDECSDEEEGCRNSKVGRNSNGRGRIQRQVVHRRVGVHSHGGKGRSRGGKCK